MPPRDSAILRMHSWWRWPPEEIHNWMKRSWRKNSIPDLLSVVFEASGPAGEDAWGSRCWLAGRLLGGAWKCVNPSEVLTARARMSTCWASVPWCQTRRQASPVNDLSRGSVRIARLLALPRCPNLNFTTSGHPHRDPHQKLVLVDLQHPTSLVSLWWLSSTRERSLADYAE